VNQAASLTQFPAVSVLQNTTLVNGQMQQVSRYRADTGGGMSSTNSRPVNLSDLINRLVASEKAIAVLEARLSAATIEANCSDGEVTVALNI